jgi:hypothetical protein
MKTILRILIILLVGIFVASALYLIVENIALLSDAGGFPEGVLEFGERSEMPDDRRGERPEGDHDHHAASWSRGLTEIGVSLAKLTGITLVVLLIQSIFTWWKRRLPGPSAQSAESTYDLNIT